MSDDAYFMKNDPYLLHASDPTEPRDMRDWVIAIREVQTIAEATAVMEKMFERLRDLEKLE